MRKTAVLVCCSMLMTVLSSCGSVKETDTTSVPAATEMTGVTTVQTTASGDSVPSSSESADDIYHHEFNTHVYSFLYEENFDEKIKASYISLCDAMYSGGDEFICEDEVMYYTVVDTIAHASLPLAVFIDRDKVNIKDGTAHISYTLPKDEYLNKVEEFRTLINTIIEENIRPEYDDIDKALALYTYIASNYTYDYDALEDDSISLSVYRFFTERKGICQEIAPAYSYLLAQAGVDTTTCGSLNAQNDAHEWSFVKLDGEYYHIDPTWAIDAADAYNYFGMTDEQRRVQGGWDMSILNYGSANIFDDRGVYKANSERFKDLWYSVTGSTDYDTNTISYYLEGDSEVHELVY